VGATKLALDVVVLGGKSTNAKNPKKARRIGPFSFALYFEDSLQGIADPDASGSNLPFSGVAPRKPPIGSVFTAGSTRVKVD
jgi:hypothetical protein